MNMARQCAGMSRARRLQVGAVIVKDDNILSFGWNGTPSGWHNDCEIKEYNPSDVVELSSNEADEVWPHTEDIPGGSVRRYRLKTKPEVLHAEMNALMKLSRSPNSGQGATLFLTHSPCIHCAKGTFQAGISEVIYAEAYRDNDGLDFLHNCEVHTEHYYG